MDPIAYPACVKCQITITQRFNLTCCNHYYCLTCALREIRDGKPCKVCGKALYLFLVQGNTPISKALRHLYAARQRDAKLEFGCILSFGYSSS
jgi:hypothetical protein